MADDNRRYASAIDTMTAMLWIPAKALSAMVAAAAARLPTGLVGDARSLSVVAMAMLASPYITGSVVTVDGGGMLV